MNPLTPEQRDTVSAWIAEGCNVSELQRRLKEELGVSLTYLDTRLLLDDLKLRPKDPEVPAEVPEKETPEETLEPDEVLPPAGDGNVRVTIDQIAHPSALVSGKVTFSDGNTADWQLDQLGRLALNPTTPGYRPIEKDVAAFQMELQRLARSQGL